MRHKIWALGIVLLSCGVSGCSSGHKAARPAEPPEPNPDVIPAVITPAYVNAVFKVLNHINGDAVRALLKAGRVTPTVTTYLRAIYNDPLYDDEIRIAQESLHANMSNVRQPPGDIVTVVIQLVSSSPSCVFVQTRSTFQAVLIKPGPPSSSEYFRLSLKQQGDDPSRRNPTPWALSFNANYQTPTSIPDQCAGS